MIKKPKNPNRIARVNALIKRELGPILHKLLQGQKGLVTISKVETSRDMKWTKVWISIFGGGQLALKNNSEAGLPHPSRQGGTPSPLDASNFAKASSDASGRGEKGLTSLDEATLTFINKDIYHIQGEINKHFFTKIIPRISFHLDTAPRYAEHIEKLIKKIHGENDKNEQN
jgi:ribosome-binding factor A